MSPGPLRRRLAMVLTVTLAIALLTPPGWSAGVSSLTGRVVDADGVSPRPDVVVNLVTSDQEPAFRSMPTDDAGTFRIVDAEAGTYHVLVEAEEGAFLAPRTVTIEPGENRPLALSLHAGLAPGAASTAQDTGLGGPNSGFPKWGKWLAIGVIGVAGLFLVNEISKEDEIKASPF